MYNSIANEHLAWLLGGESVCAECLRKAESEPMNGTRTVYTVCRRYCIEEVGGMRTAETNGSHLYSRLEHDRALVGKTR